MQEHVPENGLVSVTKGSSTLRFYKYTTVVFVVSTLCLAAGLLVSIHFSSVKQVQLETEMNSFKTNLQVSIDQRAMCEQDRAGMETLISTHSD